VADYTGACHRAALCADPLGSDPPCELKPSDPAGVSGWDLLLPHHETGSMVPTKLKILAVDVGGSHVKILATGQKQRRETISGPTMTARQMVSGVKKLAKGWAYDAVSVGFPGPVLHNSPVAEPHNLGPGWMGFDFASAFGLPVKVINDAAMQALGSYQGGKMLFLGLGTGLGSAMIVDGIIEPMELGHLPYRKGTYEDYVGNSGLNRLGKKRWRRLVNDVMQRWSPTTS
jgi:polyphosphate glucokinase